MKDILQDIVAHTHALGFLELIKISSDKETVIESMTDTRSVILNAKTCLLYTSPSPRDRG